VPDSLSIKERYINYVNKMLNRTSAVNDVLRRTG